MFWKKLFVFCWVCFIILVSLILGFTLLRKRSEPEKELKIQPTEIMRELKLTSPAFENNGQIPVKYTCDGEDINPPLQVKEVPEGAKSLVLIVDDPDAPIGVFTHWVVWNINPEISSIEEGEVPAGGIEDQNDFGKNSYGGPCPPGGTHHYHFKLYALDKILEPDSSSKKGELEKAMEGQILDWAELIGLYRRQKNI